MAWEARMNPAGRSLHTVRWLTLGAVMAAASITAMELMLALAVLTWLALLLVGRRRDLLPNAELTILLGLLMSWNIISALAAVDRQQALAGLPSGLLLLAAPLATAVLASHDRELMRALMLLEAGLLGLWAMVELLFLWDGNPLLRVRGPFSHHMTLAGVLLVMVLQALPRPGLSPLVGEPWGRRLGRAAALAGLGGLTATLTRSAILAVVCGLATLVLTSPHPRWRRWRRPGAVLMVLLVGAAVSLPWFPGGGNQPPSAAAASVTDRLQLWRAGAAMVRDHPWLGVGPDGTRRVVAGYLDPDYQRPGVASHLHSAWLTLAAEGGLPLLALVLFFYGRGLARGRSLLAWGRDSDLVRGALAALAGFMVMGFFEDNFDDSEVFFVHMMTLAVVWQRRGRGAAGRDAPV